MGQVVVGVDESASAAQALRWAAREGELRGWAVTAVLAWGFLDQHHTIVGERFEPGAASAILDTAAGADLVVMGSPGLGWFKGLLLGSVTTQVTHHAETTVVVIPPGA